jgi:CheY-like chemotaxis protein
MSKTGPVIILDDDLEDQELLRDAFKELGILNPLLFFNNGVSALEYLQADHEQPFLILSDINLPLMNGLQFREHIAADEFLRRKSIPFVFLSTSADKSGLDMAYELTVQGYFIKESTYSAIKETIKQIYDYWSRCRHPNSA